MAHPPPERSGFLDLFSERASAYAAARPGYPDELFAFLASLVPRRRLAWDCATGNGQAARDLARHFDSVTATDASAQQIAHAVPVRNVEYRVAPAESSGLDAGSVDLVTVAQALHWLDHAPFFAEVRRVTARGSAIAAWCYGSCHAGADVERALREFEFDIVGPYWEAGRRWVDEGYRTIPFPFTELPTPAMQLRASWSLSQLGDYIGSWSAVAAYRRERREDPVPVLLEKLTENWRQPDRVRDVTWPLGIRVGRVE